MPSAVWAAAGSPSYGAGPRTAVRVALIEPRSIDPATIGDSSGVEVTRLLFDSLTDVRRDLEVVPAAAESWTVSPDLRTFTFTLQQGSSFANGRPVVAADFVFDVQPARRP